MILADSHTHLDQFPNNEILDVLDRARQAHVSFVISAGTNVDSSEACVKLARLYEPCYAGVGVHPMDLAGPIDEAMYGQLKAIASSDEKVVCISEIGLDFQPTSPDPVVQGQAFRQQIRLARELSLPIVVHSRNAHKDVLLALKEEAGYEVGGVMHYFQGDEGTAREAIDMGFLISLARPLLRLEELQKTAAVLPLQSLVLETDAAPQPFKKHRHNWTEPRHVHDVATKLAELKGISLEEVAASTTENLCGLLRLAPGGIIDPNL